MSLPKILQQLRDHIAAFNVHGATVAATADRLMMRDANGRGKVVAPLDGDDVALKQTVLDGDAATLAAANANLYNAIGNVNTSLSTLQQQITALDYFYREVLSVELAQYIYLTKLDIALYQGTEFYPLNGITLSYLNSASVSEIMFKWCNAGAQGKYITTPNPMWSTTETTTFVFPESGYYLYASVKDYYPQGQVYLGGMGNQPRGHTAVIINGVYEDAKAGINGLKRLVNNTGYVLLRKHGPSTIGKDNPPPVIDNPGT
jgi:hypothetical protein